MQIGIPSYSIEPSFQNYLINFIFFNNHMRMEPSPLLTTFHPYVFRIFAIITLISVLLPIISFNSWHPSLWFQCTFEKTVQNLQVWRIITGWVVEESSLIFMIAILQFLTIIHKFECKNGSAVVFNDAFVYTGALSLFVMAFQAFIFYGRRYLSPKIFDLSEEQVKNLQIVPQWFIRPGLLVIQMNFLYKYCYYNRDIIVKLPFPFTKKFALKYYPVFTYCLFLAISVLNYLMFDDKLIGLTFAKFIHIIRIQGLLALLLASVECRYLNGGFILFAIQSYTEKQYYLGFIKAPESSCWVPSNPKSLQLNHRMTISSKQFYENLGKWKYGIRWDNYKELKQNGEQSQTENILKKSPFQGEGVPIG